MVAVIQYYNKLSNWGKILIFSILFIVVISFLNNIMPQKPRAEGFTQKEEFTTKTDVSGIYDDFYANIYD